MEDSSNMSYPKCIRSLKNPIMEQQTSTKGPKLGSVNYRHTKLFTGCPACTLCARHSPRLFGMASNRKMNGGCFISLILMHFGQGKVVLPLLRFQ